MDNSNIVFLINDDIRAVKAIYDEGGSADTFKTMDPSVKVGDILVVESSTRHKVTTVKVVEVEVDINFDSNVAVKWVVAKVNMDAFADILVMENDAIAAVNSAERKRKKDALRASLFADHQDKLKTLALSSDKGGDLTE
jgi:hypothetical protein